MGWYRLATRSPNFKTGDLPCKGDAARCTKVSCVLYRSNSCVVIGKGKIDQAEINKSINSDLSNITIWFLKWGIILGTILWLLDMIL